MTVTEKHPDRIGQRVQEPYGDTRGWVIGFDGPDVEVDWDDANPEIDAQVGLFHADQLRVVVEVRIDADHLLDPGLSPHVEQVVRGADKKRTRYKFKDGTMSQGINAARNHLLSLHTFG